MLGARGVLLATVVASATALKLRELNPLRALFREEPYLVEFHASHAEQCDEMKPVMRRVERKLGTRFLKYEVWSDPAAYKLMQFLDKNPAGKSQCGGLPFFYNRKTGAVVCGATTEANLENWAKGVAHAVVLTPPPSAEAIAVAGRATGARARRGRLANAKKREAIEKMRGADPKRAAALEAARSAPPSARRLPPPLKEA